MAQKRQDLPGIVAPPPILYAVPLTLGLVLQHYRPERLMPPGISHLLGWVFAALSLLGFVALVSFRRARTSPNPWRPTTTLVVGGPYQVTRNPMYVGFTLMYLATACVVNTLWPVLALPVVLVVMQRGVILREEEYLERRFGAEYLAYKARVRRWL